VLILAVFVLGYAAIVLEHPLGINKSATALAAGVLCWTVLVLQGEPDLVNARLAHSLYEISGIVFFLLGAMTVVELIDAHDGFELITSRIRTVSRRRLLATIAILAFLLSALLDNLTTSIVMMSLVRKLVPDADRRYFGSIVIIASNSGGVWSPIGDVTTTMLWIGGQVTPATLTQQLVLPALASVVVPVLWIGWRMRGDVVRPQREASPHGLAELTGVEAALDVNGQMPIRLPPDAAAIGQTLAQLNLRVRTGASVATICTHGGQPAPPSPTAPLHPEDTLVLTGTPTAIAHALALLIAARRKRPQRGSAHSCCSPGSVSSCRCQCSRPSRTSRRSWECCSVSASCGRSPSCCTSARTTMAKASCPSPTRCSGWTRRA
jgi:hypothetical protein